MALFQRPVRNWRAWLPAGVLAGNLAAFLLSASGVLSGAVAVSHHWLMPFHEGLLYLQVVFLGPGAPVRMLAFLSLLVLGISVARLETIFFSHHLLHLSLAWAIGVSLHRRLAALRAAPWGTFNGSFAVLAALWAGLTLVVAVSSGVWWGIGGGT